MSKVVGKSRESRRASKSRAPSSEKNVSTAVQTSESADVAEAEIEVVEAVGGGDALTRYADVLENRNRLIDCKGWIDNDPICLLVGVWPFRFYRNKNGRLPAEIESAFTCACDELRQTGQSGIVAAAMLEELHEDLTKKFAETAEFYQEAMRLEQKYDDAEKLEEPFKPALLKERHSLQWEDAAYHDRNSPEHKQWQDAHDQWRVAVCRAFTCAEMPTNTIARCGWHLWYTKFTPSLKSLEECFEQNVAAIRRIIKAGVKDRSAEAVEAVKKLMEQKIGDIAAMMKNTSADVAEIKSKVGTSADGEKDQDASRTDGDGAATHGQSCATSDGEQTPATSSRRETTTEDRLFYAVYKNRYVCEDKYRNCRTDKSKKRGQKQFYLYFKDAHIICGQNFAKTLGETYQTAEDFEKTMDAVRKNNVYQGRTDENESLLSRGMPEGEYAWHSATDFL
jgi:hypothetical protein